MQPAPGARWEPLLETVEAALDVKRRREQVAADETWKNCYDEKERIAYIRKFHYQFDFRDFADLLACVRGKYFAGYASELIY